MPSATRALALVLAVLLMPAVIAQQSPTTPEAPEPPEGTPTPETPEQVGCRPPVETCLPDLVPSGLREENVDERMPTMICGGFYNLGAAPTASPFRILLYVDGTPAAEHQFTGQYQRGQGEEKCWDGLMLVRGRHNMSIFVDSNKEIVEEDEANNMRSAAFSVARAPQVDLRLTSLEITPKEGGSMMNQLFVVNVTNVGTNMSPATSVRLSDDNGPMTTMPVGPLRPGESRSVVHATRPDYRPVGAFIARAVVDLENNITELREDNNAAMAEYVVLDHPTPDYALPDVQVRGNMTAMRGLYVDTVVENVGDGLVRGAVLRIMNETGSYADATRRDTLYAGRNYTLQFMLVLPAGEHSLRLVVDPRGQIAERNESNNIRYLNLTIAEPLVALDLPNLVIERIVAMPEDPRPGEPISLGALVHNIGSNTSNATVVNFSVDGKHVGSAAVPALKPDRSHMAYVAWSGGPEANYNISATVDQAERVSELGEDDNTLALGFFIGTTAAEERPEPKPTTPTPPTLAPPTVPTPATPKPTPPPTPAPPRDTASRIALNQLEITTRPVPGGLKGIFSVSLRNPNIQPVGLVTVAFKVDGEQLKEVLVNGIRGAATTSATTGEIDVPEGKHTVTAEVRIVGSSLAPVTRSEGYEAKAGDKEGIPGVAPLGGALAAASLVLFRRRRG